MLNMTKTTVEFVNKFQNDNFISNNIENNKTNNITYWKTITNQLLYNTKLELFVHCQKKKKKFM